MSWQVEEAGSWAVPRLGSRLDRCWLAGLLAACLSCSGQVKAGAAACRCRCRCSCPGCLLTGWLTGKLRPGMEVEFACHREKSTCQLVRGGGYKRGGADDVRLQWPTTWIPYLALVPVLPSSRFHTDVPV